MGRKQVYEVYGGQLYIAAVQPAGAGSIAVQVRQSDRFHPALSGATSKATAGQRTESCEPVGAAFVQEDHRTRPALLA